MLATSPDFWALFWALIGGGAALTVLMTLFVATMPVHRLDRQQPPAASAGAAPDRGDSGKHLPAAA